MPNFEEVVKYISTAIQAIFVCLTMSKRIKETLEKKTGEEPKPDQDTDPPGDTDIEVPVTKEEDV